MSDVASKTIKHTTIYAAGIGIRQLASLVMLPIYTRFLTPTDYGVIELLTMTIDFVSVILGFGIGDAVFRHYMLYEKTSDRHEVVSTALLAIGSLNLLGAALLGSAAHPLAGAVLGARDQAGLLRLFSLSLLFAGVAETSFVFIRAQQRPWLFVILSTLRLVLQLSLNIYFVVLESMHVEGVIYSTVLSGAVMCTVLSTYTAIQTSLKWSAAKARELFSFSWPLMLSSIGAYYITFGDRFFLRALATMDEVGVYSLAYRFGFLLVMLAWTPFTSIWESQRYEISKRGDAKSIFGSTFVLVTLVLLAASLGIALFAPDVLRVMAAAPFWRADRIVPVVLAAYVFQCWTAYANFGIMLHRDTKQITYATILAVIVITIGYAGLIPLLGGLGAAWATLAGMVARFLWVYRQGKRHYDMELPWRTVGQLSALTGVAYLVSRIGPSSLVASVTVHASVFSAFVAFAVALPILRPEDRTAVIAILRKPAGAMRALALRRL